jgi:hypothetical protein
VQDELPPFHMGIFVKVIDALRVEQGSPPFNAVDRVAFFH